MDFKDYYQVMGVDEQATAAEIKQAYRKLARKFHPDVSKESDAEARFKEVGEAYEVLGDSQKRAEYDRIRALRAAGGARSSAGDGMSEAEARRQFEDFFESIFGSGMAGQSAYRSADAHYREDPFRQDPHRETYSEGAFRRRGQDLHHRLALFLEEAAQGVQRTLKLEVPDVDSRGRLHSKTKTLNVKIPAGVTAGQRIRLAGQGEPGYGGAPDGDLFLEIELAPHPVFAVDGRDVLLTLPVTPWEAALGAKVAVPTLSGPVKLTIPAGSVTGKKLRLKGRGLGVKPSGDQIVSLQVTLPPRHSPEAESLYRQLAEEQASFNPRQPLEERL